jgi:hypothetical protein
MRRTGPCSGRRPGVRWSPHSSRRASHGIGHPKVNTNPRIALPALALAVACGACGVSPTPAPSAGPTVTPVPPVAVTSSPPASPSLSPPTSPEPTAGASPEPTAGAIDPSTFLQLCARRPAEGGASIACDEAVRTALESLGATVSAVVRVDTRYICPDTAASCATPERDRIVVLVTSGASTVEMTLARAEGGELAVAAVQPGALPRAPAFEPPPVARAPFDGAPASVANRAAYPLCGIETTGPYGPFDTAKRECFWTGSHPPDGDGSRWPRCQSARTLVTMTPNQKRGGHHPRGSSLRPV